MIHSEDPPRTVRAIDNASSLFWWLVARAVLRIALHFHLDNQRWKAVEWAIRYDLLFSFGASRPRGWEEWLGVVFVFLVAGMAVVSVLQATYLFAVAYSALLSQLFQG